MNWALWVRLCLLTFIFLFIDIYTYIYRYCFQFMEFIDIASILFIVENYVSADFR